jgi:predicted Zn-dependent peptidase
MTNYNTVTLPSGLRIIHLPSASPVVYCGYQIAAGTRDELPGEEGLAHFCEHMTFKGTERRNALQIINALERLGGELNAYTNKESTVFYAAVQKEHFRVAVDLLSDMVFNSRYPQAEMNREVEVICDEIESYNDSPAELIYDEFENILFEGHPLGHNILGQADKLRSYTSDDLLRFTQRHYVPMKSVFFAYGDIDFQRLIRSLPLAPSLRGGKASPCPPPTGGGILTQEVSGKTSPLGEVRRGLPPSSFLVPPSSKKDSSFLIKKIGTHQAHVIIGTRAYAAGDPRRMVLYLVNNLLGGPSMNARLNLSLRERNGLVYTVESSMVVYGDTGVWTVYFGCDAHDVTRCRRLVRHELDKLMERPLTRTALATAKQQLKGQLAIASDNREQFALDFGKVFLFDGREHRLDRLFSRIDAITAEDVQQVAGDLFAADRLTTLVFQ